MDVEGARYGSEKAGLLCGYVFQPACSGRAIGADEAKTLVGVTAVDSVGFLWLHFNLANEASRRWLCQHLSPPEAFLSALEQTAATRVEVGAGAIVVTLNDLTLFGSDAFDASSMVVLVTERMLVSVRRTPLRSVDRLRESVRRGDGFRSPLELFAHLLHDQAAMLGQIVRDATESVDDVEDRLIANQVASSRPTLGALRRTLVKLHRLLAPGPPAFLRLTAKPPAWIAPPDLVELREAAEDIAAAAADGAALIDRIKLLQEEVFAVVSEQTNRTLFTLTVVTVLALPMTIVSGFFGMNVAGVPFQQTGGFWAVVMFTIAASTFGAVLLFRSRSRL